MLLLSRGISGRAILCDISPDSLEKARETFRLTGLPILPEDFRVGDGLEPLKPREVDTVIIGGLGGYTIRSILAADLAKTRSYRKLILQPRKHSGVLREFLYTNGFDITEEVLAEEGKFICEIIVAAPADAASRPPLFPKEDIRWAYPERFRTCDPALLARRIAWKLSAIDLEKENLRASSDDQSERIARLDRDASYLRKLVEL